MCLSQRIDAVVSVDDDGRSKPIGMDILLFALIVAAVMCGPAEAQSSGQGGGGFSNAPKPRVMILIEEKVAGVFGATGYEDVGQAESTLSEQFLNAGFEVVDSQTVRKNLPRDKALRMMEGDRRAAAVAGLQFHAEIVISGKAFSKNAGKTLLGTNMQSIHATVQASAVRTDDGSVVSSRSTSAVQAHIDELRGGAMAIRKAGVDLSNMLIPDIMNAVSSSTQDVNAVTVTVSGLVSYGHLMAVREYLEVRLDGVLGVTQRQFTRETADLLVDYIGNAMMLADAIARQRFQGFRLEPTNVTPSKPDLKVIQSR